MIELVRKSICESKEYVDVIAGEAFVFLEDYMNQYKSNISHIGLQNLYMKVETDTRTVAINFVGKEVTISPNELVVPVDLTMSWSVSE